MKHQPHTERHPCACHTKSIIVDPLQTQPSRTPERAANFATVPNSCAMRNKIWTSKNAPRPPRFNDLGFRIALQRWANLQLNFSPKVSGAAHETSASPLPKAVRSCQLTTLTSEPSLLGPQNDTKHRVPRNFYPPSCLLARNLRRAGTFTRNSQYSRKWDLAISFDHPHAILA